MRIVYIGPSRSVMGDRMMIFAVRSKVDGPK